MAGNLDFSVGDVVGSVARGGAIFDGDGGPRWYALRVASQREDQAEAWLNQRGVYGFHPVQIRKTRRFGRVREYVRRYLPGYVFAEFPAAPVIHRVLICPFITGALTLRCGAWGQIDPDGLRAIHAMRRVDADAQEAHAATKKRRRLAVALRVGDTAMFKAGPFAGVRCEVVSIKAAGGLAVRLSLFGRETSVESSVDDLVPVKKTV